MFDEKQVDKSHYEFSRYMEKGRWIGVWHQLDEVLSLKPDRVLEIGTGAGLFKKAAGLYGIKVETLDIDPELKPDYVGTATALPFEDNCFEVVCAFQVLEHLPYDKALNAFREMVRVSKKHIIISLPDAKVVWRYLLHFPKIGDLDVLFPKPFTFPSEHRFDGEHYWEINKRGYPLSRVIHDLNSECEILRTYRVKENPYHRFIVAKKITPKRNW